MVGQVVGDDRGEERLDSSVEYLFISTKKKTKKKTIKRRTRTRTVTEKANDE